MTRRVVAALIALVMSLVPLLATFDAAAAADLGAHTRQWSSTTTPAPKPCRKAVLPGTINICPFAAASLAALPANDNATAQPSVAARTLSWRPQDDALTTQCHASSPYRPPCRRS
ncbi:conserved exported hypothetical protein [Bradyrhizobium sp. ORS 375]|uniref:hypothetical protein n=1 Tax=Bradyrhizobium sp. (strain ORS 375) TaxID=566679 RepID=UPI0002408AD7|nr:hypothetical protein [Bradyrhizobium sp. ORS 375]CCD91516.1 conserved exported hypothetical protein [Bradyrhizobium sp. ORS 375]